MGAWTVWDIFKWLAIGGLLMYCVFGVVLVMQAKIMGETFDSQMNSVAKALTVMHLISAVLLVALAVVIL